jgi:hypothetical protein
MKSILFVFVSVFATASAMADQCAVLTQEQAVHAIKLLNAANSVERFCENCGEKSPTQLNPYTVDLQTFNGLGSGEFSVSVNGKLEDIAYLYVDDINLAKMVGCATTGVTPVLY